MPETSQKKHILYLDSLRALAAVYVVMHHGVLQYYTYNNPEETGLKAFLISFFFYGHYAVDLFIVISGYCLMLPLVKNNYNLKNGSLDFFKRRAKRILPTYYFAMLFSLILIWTLVGSKTNHHWDTSIPVNIYDVLAHVFLIQDIFKSTALTINHAFWSISVESRIYVLFPLLLLSWRRYGRYKTLIFTSAAALVVFMFLRRPFLYRFDISGSATGVSPYIILFMFGMLAADISTSTQIRLQAIRNRHWGFITIGFILLAGLAFTMQLKLIIPIHITDIFIGMASSSTLIYLAKSYYNEDSRNLLLKLLSWQPLAMLGTFSYSIYLVHAPLLQVLTQYVLVYLHLNKFMTTVVMITAGTAAIVVVSYLFYYLFERPFISNNKKKGLTENGEQPALTPIQ